MIKIIVGNWKMNPQSEKDVEVLLKGVLKYLKNVKNTRVIICPPFPFLFIYKKLKNKKIILGSQDVSKNSEGSHTGEVSPLMLSSMGVKAVIVGHSERRQRGESNKIANEKILNLLKFKMTPILCIGENKRDHNGFYLSFVSEQIKECLVGVSRSQIKNLIIAYEPVWAIGKDAERQATVEEFIEMKIFIKKVISDLYGLNIIKDIPILYGGSVNSLNSSSFLNTGGADGLLIGRDSLILKKFIAIINEIN